MGNQNNVHNVNVRSKDSSLLQKVSEGFLATELLEAQNLTKEIFYKITAQVVPGMSKAQVQNLIKDEFKKNNITKHWHRPFIRFGSETLFSYADPDDPNTILNNNEHFYIDVGPVIPIAGASLEYEGDFGDTLVAGENSIAFNLAEKCRFLFQAAKEKWISERFTGEQIYNFLIQETKKFNLKIHPSVLGHRVGDFPHHKYTKEKLSVIHFTPAPYLWILEVHLIDEKNQIGAFFEDLL